MVYDPLWTTLLDRAQKAGRDVEDGAELLVQQGRKAFEHFFGSSVPRDLAHEAWVRVRDD
jgi:shikimate 5-dehydrogenase